MKKLTIKEIIEFKGKSDKTKKNFVASIKRDEKKASTDGGGDYWASCLSAISNCYKSNNLQLITDKQKELGEKFGKEKNPRTKVMYGKNIDILYSYENFDFKGWRPKKLEFLVKRESNSILTVKGLRIQAKPHHVFTFKRNEIEEIGAIWFIAKIGGYKKDELGMFADVLYTYLETHYSKDYSLNSNYCIAVDVFKNFSVNYSQLKKGEVREILNPTLDEIRKLM